MRLLVEFKTSGRGLFGGRKVYRTVEWVTLQEPDRIQFDGVEGPLSMLHDIFELEERGGCTLLRYKSEFGVRGWIVGWLISRFYVRPMLWRMMQEHMQEMKETIEARAQRSKVWPQRPCSPEDALDEFDRVREPA